eukprot:COSAG02_NODE_59980_length_272_cov_1.190751_1_plen_40_part_10
MAMAWCDLSVVWSICMVYTLVVWLLMLPALPAAWEQYQAT